MVKMCFACYEIFPTITSCSLGAPYKAALLAFPTSNSKMPTTKFGVEIIHSFVICTPGHGCFGRSDRAECKENLTGQCAGAAGGKSAIEGN